MIADHVHINMLVDYCVVNSGAIHTVLAALIIICRDSHHSDAEYDPTIHLGYCDRILRPTTEVLSQAQVPEKE